MQFYFYQSPEFFIINSLLLMFSLSSISPHHGSISPFPDSISLDVQYEICSKFMKLANENLYQKELQLISSTSKFIDRIQDSLALKDISTQQSITLDNYAEEDQSFSQPSRSRLLLRKSKSNTSLRRSESGINQALREVQSKCSDRTCSMLINIAGEYRCIKEKMACSQKFQKELKRLQGRYRIVEEDLLMQLQNDCSARKRVSDLEKENKMQTEEVQSLRKRVRDKTHPSHQASLQVCKSTDNLKPHMFISTGDRMKAFLEQKQLRIYKKEKQLKKIQDRLQMSFEDALGDQPCEKCCFMMKRIKDAIMRYRSMLEQEANTADQCYHTLKQQIQFS